MPKEVRYILFSPEEVLPAVLGHLGERKGIDPSGRGMPLLEVFTTEFGDVAARVVRPSHRSEGREVREVARSDLIAALLGHCRAMRIPLPRRAQKSLEMMGDRIAMTVLLNTSAVRVEATQGSIRYSDAEADALREKVA